MECLILTSQISSGTCHYNRAKVIGVLCLPMLYYLNLRHHWLFVQPNVFSGEIGMFSTHPTFSTSAKTPAVKGKHWHTILARKWSCSLKRFTKKKHTYQVCVCFPEIFKKYIERKEDLLHSYVCKQRDALHASTAREHTHRFDHGVHKESGSLPEEPTSSCTAHYNLYIRIFLIKIVNL